MTRRLFLGFLTALVVLGCERGASDGAPAPSATQSAPVGELDPRFEPLVSEFEAASKKVRVLALLSPT